MYIEDAVRMMKSYALDLDRHFDDEYVRIFKGLSSNFKGAIKGMEDEFFIYLRAYTGGERDLNSFLELITGAMEEITDGLYKEDDRDFLYEKLRFFEAYGLRLHYQSFWGMFPFGLNKKYSSGGIGEDRKILVPLNQYRNMQYSLLLLRERLNKLTQLHPRDAGDV